MIDYIESLNELKSDLQEKQAFNVFLKDISLFFIPGFTSSFDISKNKVVVVGQETGAWMKRYTLESFIRGDLNTSQMILESKQRYNDIYKDQPERSFFLQFLERVKENNNKEPVQWLNFYICNYKDRSFNFLNKKNKSIDLYKVIRDFSIKNLVKQLNRLEPKNIFFLGAYHGNWETLKKHYVCNEEIIYLKTPIAGFSLRFWNMNTLVIRMPHPASRISNKNKIQKQALAYFELFNNEANQDPQQFKLLIGHELKL